MFYVRIQNGNNFSYRYYVGITESTLKLLLKGHNYSLLNQKEYLKESQKELEKEEITNEKRNLTK